MYDPLIKIEFSSFKPTFIRCSDIKAVEPEDGRVHLKSGTKYNFVSNGNAVIELVNEIENRNELSLLINT